MISDQQLVASLRRLAPKAGSGAELSGAICDEVLALFAADASAVFRFDGDEIVVVGSAAAPGQQVFIPGARVPLEPELVAA